MKKLLSITFLILASSFSSSSLNAQDYMDMLKTKSYKQFAKHLDNSVQLEIRREKKTLSKDQVVKQVAERLNMLNPVRWELVHKGESEEKAGSYIVLKAYNDKNEGVRIFLHISEIDGLNKISSIRFRKLL